MNTKLKNLTKVLLGVAVLGGSAGMAVYAQVQKATKLSSQMAAIHEAEETGRATMRFWVNDQATGQYQEVTTPPTPLDECKDVDSHACVIQSENPSLPSSLTYSQALPTPSNGIQSHPDSSPAFYQ